MVEPRRALAHPVWLLALVVLVVNDHVLKAYAWPTGAVAGKLSDVAGLLVAPALLATLIRARSDVALAVAWLAVGAGFAAIKLSPDASAAYERALWFVDARNVVDPTDLLALVALPVGWIVLRPAMDEATAPGWASRASVIAGAIACIATPAPPPKPCPPGAYGNPGQCSEAFTATTWLGNPGTRAMTVEVQTIRRETGITCDALAADPVGWACTIGAGAFTTPRAVTVRRDENVPIDAALDGCAVALVTLDDWRPPVLVMMRWSPGMPAPTTLVPHVGRIEASSAIVGGVLVEPDGPSLTVTAGAEPYPLVCEVAP